MRTAVLEEAPGVASGMVEALASHLDQAFSRALVPAAKQLAEEVFCSRRFGFGGAPDFSPAIAVGLDSGL